MKISHLAGGLLALASSLSASAITIAAPSTTVASSSTPLVFTGNGNNLATGSFAGGAQSADLYISMRISFAAGAINRNDFVALWLDNSASGTHTAVPNIGFKANRDTSADAAADYFVRLNSQRLTTSNQALAYDAKPNASVGATVDLFAHLYKSAGSSTYNRLDLWAGENQASGAQLLDTAPGASLAVASGLASVSQFGFRAANLDAGDRVEISNFSITTAVPEPSTYLMMGLGLAGLALVARRRRG